MSLPSPEQVICDVGTVINQVLAPIGLQVPTPCTTSSPSGGQMAVTIQAQVIPQGGTTSFFDALGLQIFSVTANVSQTILYTATIVGGVPPYTSVWAWGDGTANTNGTAATSTTQTASHAYTAGGSYTVTCTVTDSISNTASGTDTTTIATTTTLIINTPTYAQTNTTVSTVAKLSDSAGPIVGELITFNYVFTNGTTGVQTATTDSTGTATASVLSSSITGVMTVYASFAGDATKGLDAATSATNSITVYAPLTVTVGP